MEPLKVLVLLLTISSLKSTNAAMKYCPYFLDIYCQCTVYNDDQSMNIDCLGADQQQFNSSIQAILDLNHEHGHPIDEPLEINTLWLWGTGNTEIDLSMLFTLRMVHFLLDSNPYLTAVTATPPPGAAPDSLIQISKSLYISKSNLSDQEMATALTFFNTNITYLHLGGGRLQGGHHPIPDGSGDIEFLPGLSRFKLLQQLHLFNNPMENLTISGGQFKRFPHLETLSLEGASRVIGTDAFLFDEPTDNNFANLTLTVILERDNHTYEAGYTGISAYQRTIRLDLTYGDLVTIPEHDFGEFLRINPRNSLYLKDNWRLQCDERVKWLKDGRAEFEHRVEYADCANDEGFTVFNSSLVP